MRRVDARGRTFLAIDVRGNAPLFLELADAHEVVFAILDAVDGLVHVCPRGSCYCG